MATFDVLRRIVAAGHNFVITHEPTFYNHQDTTAALEQDGVFRAKQRFIAEHGLVVFRFHDHAHALRPDPLVTGSARALGLTAHAVPGERNLFVVPPTSLRELAAGFAARLPARGLRVVGRPDAIVSRIAVSPGYGAPALGPGIDVSIGGELSEAGGNAEYAADAAALGQAKGLILLGHMMSEDWGMREVADWIRAFVPEVPVEWIAAGEPFA
jgi:putative NIF3 family GTP cyclohydrolase 1 type 2